MWVILSESVLNIYNSNQFSFYVLNMNVILKDIIDNGVITLKRGKHTPFERFLIGAYNKISCIL